jgi:hypothetical protein
VTGATLRPPAVYDPYDYAIHEDPYPTYARLRAEAPDRRSAALGLIAPPGGTAGPSPGLYPP